MALSTLAKTRIDQLAADLALVRAAVKAQVPPPDERPLFTTHQDGSVWTREGKQIRPPAAPAR